MRSVFVFTAVEPNVVASRLEAIGAHGSHGEWTIEGNLYVSVEAAPEWQERAFEWEDQRPDIEARVGDTPTLVAVDVSGRIDGRHEAREFALQILGLGVGVAFDDYDEHAWTAEELASNQQFDGRHFFENPLYKRR